jgi:hypothetical protein
VTAPLANAAGDLLHDDAEATRSPS